MKLTKKLLMMGAVTGLSFMTYSQMANATDATGTATAEIRAAITLAEDTAMDFATITADPAGDTISLTATGSISAANTSDLSGTAVAGGFTATGDANAAVSISFSSGDTLTGTGTAMPLGNFSHDAGGSPAFDASGDLDFDVGADLTVNASQTAGTYSGTYTVTVDYN